MNTFRIRTFLLPHEGIIPGAAGHKKIVVPKGTRVYCIVYGTLIYWCAYLNEEQASKCMRGLEASTDVHARRYIPLETLLTWNFGRGIPRRICRELV